MSFEAQQGLVIGIPHGFPHWPCSFPTECPSHTGLLVPWVPCGIPYPPLCKRFPFPDVPTLCKHEAGNLRLAHLVSSSDPVPERGDLESSGSKRCLWVKLKFRLVCG